MCFSVWLPGGLSAGHVHAGFGFVERMSSMLTSTVTAVDGGGELERAGVVVGDRRAGVSAAGQRARVEHEQDVMGASVFPARVPST
jgi:hypothetical protein